VRDHVNYFPPPPRQRCEALQYAIDYTTDSIEAERRTRGAKDGWDK